MKKKLIVLLLVISAMFFYKLHAQVMPFAYNAGIKINYVRTWDATAPIANADTLIVRPLKDVRQTTQYFDGLGRPIQTVIKKASMATDSTPVDLVTTVLYDSFGREQYKFLPFAANNTGGNTAISDGLFKMNPFAQQAAFYSSSNSSSPINNQEENYFYSKTNFEASVLNRITDTYASGNSWVGSEFNPDTNQRRNIQVKYLINTTIDSVRIWTVTNNDTIGKLGSYSSSAAYAASTLFKIITTDEHKRQVIEFKDKNGKVILKKVQLTASSDYGIGSGYTGWLCTYYIYDDLGNLRCVIQPEAVKSITSTWSLTTTLLDEQCFRYVFDRHNHMIVKKVPGAGEVWMLYDARGRLVLTQDVNLRNSSLKKWLYMQYDDLNRPIATGFITDNSNYNNIAYHISRADTSIAYPLLAGYTSEELTHTFYDDYSWLSSYSNPLPSTYTSSYDSYFQSGSSSVWPYPQTNAQSAQTTGMVTGSRTKILGTSNTYLYAVNFYDDKGRPIQSLNTNITGDTAIVTTQYTWAGQPYTVVQKEATHAAYTQSHITATKMQYDSLGRVLNIKKTVNSIVNSVAITKPEQLIVQNRYDKLGQLKKKTLGNNNLETLTYDYNIRGWLLGVNRAYAKDSSTNYFGFDLGYEKADNKIIGSQVYNNPQYNGNIEGMVWKSKGDAEKRKYDFAYDAANRLMRADFTQYTGSTFNQTAGINFNMKMGDGTDVTSAYDGNGNIKRMQQWGLKVNASDQIDNLIYNYQASSNKLAKVTDSVTTDNKLGDFKDGNISGDDYAYDANGNLLSDKNKKIDSIYYNHLNLPYRIRVNDSSNALKGIIEYTYDAGGNKLQKKVTEGSKITTTNYIDGFIYQNDTLQFAGQEEGRIRFKPATSEFEYDYMLKDHLGNVRMVLTEEHQVDKYPVASLESSKRSTELQFYTIDTTRIVDASSVTGLSSYTNDNGIGNNPSDGTFEAANSAKLYKLKSTEAKMGLGITLKVMAGDTMNVFGKSYYFNNNTGGTGSNSTVPIVDILSGLLGGPGASVTTSVHGTVNSTLITPAVNTGSIYDLFTAQNSQTNSTPTKPRAFINVIFFDEQFKAVDYKISMVGDSNQVKNHTDLQNLVATKNGFVYIYCSNESPVNVFFDNLQVVHTRGAILEETHYYPFGLTMAGISSKAAGSLDNKKKYNGYELNTDFDINIDESFYRLHDPQLGRFLQIDPKPRIDESPYNAMGDNPIKYADRLGDIYRLNGSTDDIKDYISFLEKTTGNKYKVNKNGELVRTNKKLNTKTTDKISGTLSKNIDDAIKRKETVTFNLVNNDAQDKGISFDTYKSGNVDMKDLAKLKDNAFLAGILGHFLEESSQEPDISKRDPGSAAAKAAHNKGSIMEGQIVTEMSGLPNHARVESHSRILIFQSGPNKGEKTIEYYYDYGQVKYTLRWGVTSTKGVGYSTESSNGILYSAEKQ